MGWVGGWVGKRTCGGCSVASSSSSSSLQVVNGKVAKFVRAPGRGDGAGAVWVGGWVGGWVGFMSC